MHGGSHVTWKCKHCFLELKTSQDTVGLLKKKCQGVSHTVHFREESIRNRTRKLPPESLCLSSSSPLDMLLISCEIVGSGDLHGLKES